MILVKSFKLGKTVHHSEVKTEKIVRKSITLEGQGHPTTRKISSDQFYTSESMPCRIPESYAKVLPVIDLRIQIVILLFSSIFCSYVFPTMQKIGEELVCVLDQLK